MVRMLGDKTTEVATQACIPKTCSNRRVQIPLSGHYAGCSIRISGLKPACMRTDSMSLVNSGDLSFATSIPTASHLIGFALNSSKRRCTSGSFNGSPEGSRRG